MSPNTIYLHADVCMHMGPETPHIRPRMLHWDSVFQRCDCSVWMSNKGVMHSDDSRGSWFYGARRRWNSRRARHTPFPHFHQNYSVWLHRRHSTALKCDLMWRRSWNWHTGSSLMLLRLLLQIWSHDCVLDFQPTSQSCWPGSRTTKTMRKQCLVFFFIYAVAIKAENQSKLDLINRKEHVCCWAGRNQTSLQTEAMPTGFISEQSISILFISGFPRLDPELSQENTRAEALRRNLKLISSHTDSNSIRRCTIPSAKAALPKTFIHLMWNKWPSNLKCFNLISFFSPRFTGNLVSHCCSLHKTHRWSRLAVPSTSRRKMCSNRCQ